MADVVGVRFCGTGGQGVLLMGNLLGAAAVAHGLWAAGHGSYGAQARGGRLPGQHHVRPAPADDPHLDAADLLVALSQEAYDAYRPAWRTDGLAVVARPGVAAADGDGRPHVAVPAAGAAADAPHTANVVLLAAAAAVAGLVPEAALARAVEIEVPARAVPENLRAVAAGFALGREARRAAGPAVDRWAARLAPVLGPRD